MGPRPALPNEVATYNDYQRQRLLVKPGMTCYWQTRRNRDSITFDEWVDLDLWHEKGCSHKILVDRRRRQKEQQHIYEAVSSRCLHFSDCQAVSEDVEHMFRNK